MQKLFKNLNKKNVNLDDDELADLDTSSLTKKFQDLMNYPQPDLHETDAYISGIMGKELKGELKSGDLKSPLSGLFAHSNPVPKAQNSTKVNKKLLVVKGKGSTSSDSEDEEELQDFVEDPQAIDFGFDWVKFPTLSVED